MQIPLQLRNRDQWVLWKTVQRGRPTKVPFQPCGKTAKPNDSATWSTFDDVAEYLGGRNGFDGIGFVFSSTDPFCGIDLDGCRNPETGKVEDWARQIILDLDTYAEVSPSQTGAKAFIVGKLPFGGRKKDLDHPRVCAKQPGIEVYDQLRYFAITGQKLKGPAEPQERNDELQALCRWAWPDTQSSPINGQFYSPDAAMNRARKYLAKVPPAISGQSGHNATFHAACILVCGFQLTREQALAVLGEWNQACEPPWTDRELEHKVDSAAKQPGPRGYLRNQQQERWDSVDIPKYEEPKQPTRIEITTLDAAARKYLGRIRAGDIGLIDTGLPQVDAAIGGGVEAGEEILIVARPSHCKSLVAMQCAHQWTMDGMPVVFVTEEMSPIALGKRALQFASEFPEEHWATSVDDLEKEWKAHNDQRAPCHIVSSCGTVDKAVEQITKAVDEYGVRAAIVDYAQLLQSKGNSRYEQMTRTSALLRNVASSKKIVLLVLCQSNREIEKRTSFIPKMSDIKETGAFEQDADVILFLVWPHRINMERDPKDFQLFILKNRNRAINQAFVECQILPSRQMIVDFNYNTNFSASEWYDDKTW